MEEIDYSGFKTLFGETPTTKVLDFFLKGRRTYSDYSLSEIAEGSGIGWTTVNEIFPALVSACVVKETRQIGRARMYALNAESQIVRKILELEGQLKQCGMVPAGATHHPRTGIKVFGIGAFGIDVTKRLQVCRDSGAGIIVVDSDKSRLENSEAPVKMLVECERYRSAADDVTEWQKLAMLDHHDELKEILKDTSSVFIVVDCNGADGNGDEARLAGWLAGQAKPALAVVIALLPDKPAEGTLLDIATLKKSANNCIILANPDKLVGGNVLLKEHKRALSGMMVAEWIDSLVECLSVPSLMNVDYADMKAVMTKGGVAVIGMGESSSENNRAEEAVRNAMDNPLLDVSYEGATGALLQVVGGPDMTLDESQLAGEIVAEKLGPRAQMMLGVRIEPEMEGSIKVLLVMAGVKVPMMMA